MTIQYFFLDDIGDAPTTFWRVFRDPLEFLKEIKSTLPQKVVISFDHDLGENTISGYKVACELERMVMMGEWKPDFIKLMVHSQNPVGVAKLKVVCDNIMAMHWEQIREEVEREPELR